MQRSYQATIEDIGNRPLEEALRLIIDDIYPQLFQNVAAMSGSIASLEAGDDFSTLSGMIQRLNVELDGMYQKERLVLFPYILKLQSEEKISPSCKPFDAVKQHYKAMLYVIAEARAYCKDFVPRENDSTLTEKLDDFEKRLIPLQQLKDKMLYPKFRNCANCCGKKG